VVTTSRPAPYTRRVAVYVPRQYVPQQSRHYVGGRPDGIVPALDNLIAEHRLPVMIAISMQWRGRRPGSERGWI